MAKPKDFRDILNLWEFDRDIAADLGIDPRVISAWRRRNSIPAHHWRWLLGSADYRGVKLDANTLMRVASELHHENSRH